MPCTSFGQFSNDIAHRATQNYGCLSCGGTFALDDGGGGISSSSSCFRIVFFRRESCRNMVLLPLFRWIISRALVLRRLSIEREWTHPHGQPSSPVHFLIGLGEDFLHQTLIHGHQSCIGPAALQCVHQPLLWSWTSIAQLVHQEPVGSRIETSGGLITGLF